MAKVLGIIGGGQLGMMITEAAKLMPDEIADVIVLDPTVDCPASLVGAKQIVADFKDRDAIIQLAHKSDIITYEIESGDSDVLKSVEQYTEINPSPETLRIIQDKFLQKSFLSDNNIPVPEFVVINDVNDLKQGLKKFGFPALLKTRRGGYDGRGNFKIQTNEDIQKAYDHFNGEPMLLEKFVSFDMEVSVIASRNTHGQIKTYPLVENIHKDNILRTSIAPARVTDSIASKARVIARDVMSVLLGSGTFGIEMFVMGDGEVLVNEIAPRVHNSGHHTLQSSKTSQFEQHLRAILGLELGSTDLVYNTVMYNILGGAGFNGKYKFAGNIDGADKHDGDNGLFLKMYGKKVSKPLRKLGHVNMVGMHGESVDILLDKLDQIKEKMTIVSSD